MSMPFIAAMLVVALWALLAEEAEHAAALEALLIV